MFAPEGYISLERIIDEMDNIAGRILAGHLIGSDGKDPAAAFDLERPDWSIEQFRLVRQLRAALGREKLGEEDFLSNDAMRISAEIRFERDILASLLLHRLLLYSDTLLFSIDGRLVHPHPRIFSHRDELDWVGFNWPVRATTELWRYFELFDQKKFSVGDIGERYLFLDLSLGVIRFKNSSAAGWKEAHPYASEYELNRFVDCHVVPFEGWSVVWNPENLPDLHKLFETVELLPSEWGVSKAHDNQPRYLSSRKRGVSASPAKAEYYRRYPDGKPANVSFDAIAEELSSSGFPITARALGNYERERLESGGPA